MDETVYDFDLHIEKSDDRCFARVVRSPAGEAVCPFRNPFSLRELDILSRRLANAGAGAQLDENGVDATAAAGQWADLARQGGQQLFEATFQDGVLACFHRSLEAAYVERARLCIRIRLDDTHAWSALPWEYLYDPHREQFVNLSVHSPMVRHVEQMHRAAPTAYRPPLRMLVVITGRRDPSTLDSDAEWLRLVDSLDYLAAERRLVLERLVKPTLLDLQRRLRQDEVHILHFMGQATYDATLEDGVLQFEDEMGRPRPVHGLHLGALLRDRQSLRLVTFEARGPVQSAVRNPFVTAALSAVTRGVAAALAVQSPLAPAARLSFMRTYYDRIAHGQPVDVAVAEARRSLVLDGLGPEWGIPVLIGRMRANHLFDDGSLPAAARQEQSGRRPSSAFDSLRIRAANRDTIASWRTELPDTN